MIKRFILTLTVTLSVSLQAETNNQTWLKWLLGYNTVAEYISEQFVRPQFKRIKEKELPEIMETVEEKALDRVPRLVDKGLAHLGNELKPYGIGGLIIAGSVGAGVWIYNRVANAGLGGLIRRFKRYDQSVNTDAQILDKQIIRLRRMKLESVDTKEDEMSIQELNNLLIGYKGKIEDMLKKIAQFQNPTKTITEEK